MVLILQFLRDGQFNPKPMGRPARTEPVAFLSRLEFMRGRLFEGGTVEIGWRVNGELNVVGTGSAAFFDLTVIGKYGPNKIDLETVT